MTLEFALTPLSLLSILLSLIALGTVLFLRGKYVVKPIPRENLKKSLIEQKREVTFKDFVKVNALLFSVLAVVVPFAIAVIVFEISGEQIEDFDTIGPWGITAAVTAFGGMGLGFLWLQKIK